jgi:Leucine-rich repeat (LRR) protein
MVAITRHKYATPHSKAAYLCQIGGFSISVNGNMEIPNSIEKFKKLEWLDISADSISFFSPKLCELPNLKMININRISKINTIYSKDSLCGLCKNTFNVLH